jgi:hypothetical protein
MHCHKESDTTPAKAGVLLLIAATRRNRKVDFEISLLTYESGYETQRLPARLAPLKGLKMFATLSLKSSPKLASASLHSLVLTTPATAPLSSRLRD